MSESDDKRRLGLSCPFEKQFPSLLNLDELYYMKLAYNCAIDAWRSDEVPIGAIIEYRGAIVGAAHNQVDSMGDPTAHAEILAITQASNAIGDWRLNEATLYVTKEPCPMCAGASIMARLKRVVFATPDPKMGCLGGATSLHTLPGLNHKVIVEGGLFEDECRKLIQAYFTLKRNAPNDKSKVAEN